MALFAAMLGVASLAATAMADPAATGGKLRWLPYHAAPDAQVRHAAMNQPIEGPRLGPTAPVRQANTNPFDDPFGDRQVAPQQGSPVAVASQGAPGALAEQAPPPARAAAPEAPNPLPESAAGPGPAGGARPMTDGATKSPAVSGVRNEIKARCLKPGDILMPIDKLTISTAVDPNVHGDKTPEEINRLVATKTEFDAKMWCETPKSAFPDRMTQGWAQTTFTWKASGLCHKPLYFEQAHVERYGHTTGPLTQPLVSGGLFFLTVPVLPYEMGLYPPYECMYTLGYYRPGSCAPYYLDPIPFSVRAALAEAGVWVGAIYLIP